MTAEKLASLKTQLQNIYTDRRRLDCILARWNEYCDALRGLVYPATDRTWLVREPSPEALDARIAKAEDLRTAVLAEQPSGLASYSNTALAHLLRFNLINEFQLEDFLDLVS